jgi:hypothetical protein
MHSIFLSTQILFISQNAIPHLFLHRAHLLHLTRPPNRQLVSSLFYSFLKARISRHHAFLCSPTHFINKSFMELSLHYMPCVGLHCSDALLCLTFCGKFLKSREFTLFILYLTHYISCHKKHIFGDSKDMRKEVRKIWT